MQALLNFLAGLRNAAKDAFKVQLSGSILELSNPINQIMEMHRNTAIRGISPDPIFEYTGYTIIDYLEWQTDHETDVWLRIYLKKGNTWKEANYTVAEDFSLGRICTPAYIKNGVGLWEILAYDTVSANKLFKFKLREPIIAPEGLRIFFENIDQPATHKCAMVLRGRTMA